MKRLIFILILIVTLFSCNNVETQNIDKKSFNVTYPNLKTGNRTLDLAYRIAVGDLFTNIQDYKSKLTKLVVPVFIAGIDYNNPWIRDAAINSWNGASFIIPGIAENTLYSVIDKQENGKLKITGQYWDGMLWTIGAWNHYLATGDKQFLKQAFKVTKNALEFYEETEFNPEYNLFRGLAWSDGVSEYPMKYADVNGESGAFLWPKYHSDKAYPEGYGIPMMSTYANAIYYQSYKLAIRMAKELGESQGEWDKKAEKLKHAINKYLWNPKTGQYSLYIDEEGVCDITEALADSYAIMFGIAVEKQIESIFENKHISKHGVTCGWPELPRFKKINRDGMTFGRHNVTVWPQAQGMWADVAARNRKVNLFAHELKTLSANAVRDMQFSEIYHPVTGQRYGGMQMSNGKMALWKSARRQTWGATAYIRMIFNGLFGISLSEKKISFHPVVPYELNDIKLSNLRYRDMVINISIVGNGTNIKSFIVNETEKREYALSNNLKGEQNVEIVLNE